MLLRACRLLTAHAQKLCHATAPHCVHGRTGHEVRGMAGRRVVFTSLEKFDGQSKRTLLPAEIKQIAGRAGRYGSRFLHGVVTTLNKVGLSAWHAGVSVRAS